MLIPKERTKPGVMVSPFSLRVDSGDDRDGCMRAVVALATIHAPSKGKVSASAKRHAPRAAKSSGVVVYEDSAVGAESLCGARRTCAEIARVGDSGSVKVEAVSPQTRRGQSRTSPKARRGRWRLAAGSAIEPQSEVDRTRPVRVPAQEACRRSLAEMAFVSDRSQLTVGHRERRQSQR